MFQTLKAVGLGAGLMYLFDPEFGRRRRAKLRNQFEYLGHEVATAVSEPLGEAGHRLRSVWNEATNSAGQSRIFAAADATRPAGDGPHPPVVSERVVISALGGFLMARCALRPTPWNVIMGTVGFGLCAAMLPKGTGSCCASGQQRDESRTPQSAPAES